VIYFIQGTEDFLFDQALHDIREKANVNKEDVIYYSAHDVPFTTCVLEVNSDDIFGAPKLIVLKDLAEQKISTYLSNLSDEAAKLLAASPHAIVIYFLREEALSKTLSQELAPLLKQATLVDAKKQKEKEVVAAIKKALQGRKHQLSGQELGAIAQKYQYNLSLIHNEIEQILLRKNKDEAISVDDFKTDTQFLEEQVFTLIDELERKDIDSIMYLLDNMVLHQQNVFGLLALLLKNYKEMYQIQTLSRAEYSLQDVTNTLGLHPYRAKLLFTKARIFNDLQYQVILNHIIKTEIALKTGNSQQLALRSLCLHIVNV